MKEFNGRAKSTNGKVIGVHWQAGRQDWLGRERVDRLKGRLR